MVRCLEFAPIDSTSWYINFHGRRCYFVILRCHVIDAQRVKLPSVLVQSFKRASKKYVYNGYVVRVLSIEK